MPPVTPARSPTAFEEKVYEAVSRVPFGKVTTYAEIGREIGCRSPRAIGQALKRNPYAADLVPCHRIVSSDLGIGGFAGRSEGGPVDEKLQLLIAEGITFEPGDTINRSFLFTFA